jgi:UTP--glucose-1-phosphate uridylyltransferase
VAIIDAVIPVGGLGTRLLPATKSQPKEMLPLVDKPVVQYVVEELAAAGIERLLFVTGRRKRAIEDHFDADPELERLVGGAFGDPKAGLEVLYTRQARPRGLGDALLCAASFSAGRPVVVALGDTVVTSPGDGPPVVARLIDASQGADAVLAVEEVDPQAVGRYGIVAVERGVVTEIVEKPALDAAPSRTAIAARYVLGPAVFEALRLTEPDAQGELQLTDALCRVLAGGGRIVAVPLTAGERRHDIGTIESYCAAFVELALADPRVGPGLRGLLDGAG